MRSVRSVSSAWHRTNKRPHKAALAKDVKAELEAALGILSGKGKGLKGKSPRGLERKKMWEEVRALRKEYMIASTSETSPDVFTSTGIVSGKEGSLKAFWVIPRSWCRLATLRGEGSCINIRSMWSSSTKQPRQWKQ